MNEELSKILFNGCRRAIPHSLRKILFRDDIVRSVIGLAANTILDLGGGKATSLADLKRLGKREFYSVNADVFLPYLKHSKRKAYYDDCVLCDIRWLPVREKAVDVSVCVHVIEHLAKEDGLKLVRQLEVVASKQVIIVTPVGFAELHAYDGNPWQIHKSGWMPEEFREIGFRVIGSCGLRKLRGERASSTIGSSLFSKSINFVATYISQLLSYHNADLAWEMVCTKMNF